jgi:hypothetical protein
VDDNCDGNIDEDCDVIGIGDDVYKSNPGAVITITDENGNGTPEEGETFEIEIETPTADTVTVANITEAQISATVAHPAVESNDESTMTEEQVDAVRH